MQTITEDVLRVLANPLVVNLSSDTAQTASGTASDAHACEQRMIRENGHRKAPPLTAWPPGHSQNRPAEAACMTSRNGEYGRWRLTEYVETDREHEIECLDGR